MPAHDEIIAERGDDARPVGRGEPRQRCEIEVVVMAMRDQHGVDVGQRLEGDAGIVDAPGAGEAQRRDPFRPHRIDQHVEPAGLDEQAGVADEGDA